MTVTFDTQPGGNPLPAGIYTAGLFVASNDPVAHPATIQVILHVLEREELFADGFESGDSSTWSVTTP